MYNQHYDPHYLHYGPPPYPRGPIFFMELRYYFKFLWRALIALVLLLVLLWLAQPWFSIRWTPKGLQIVATGLADPEQHISPGQDVYSLPRSPYIASDLTAGNVPAEREGLTRDNRKSDIPVGRHYIAREGDTVPGIARHFGANRYELMILNGFGERHRLFAGDTVLIPARHF